MDCKDCENYGGFDEDGCPNCGQEDNCPYNADEESEDKVASALTVNIDAEALKTHIGNKVSGAVCTELRQYIRQLAEAEFKNTVKTATKEAVERMVTQHVAEFMKGSVSVGGGWKEEPKTMTRNEYVSSIIEAQLGASFDPNKKAREIINDVSDARISNFARDLRDQVNREIKKKFDDATRNELANSVVSLLVDNETYRRLQNSMANLASGK